MAREEAERLNRLVGNLLDMTRIEAGALKLALEPADVQEVISAALERLGDRLRERVVTVTAPTAQAPLDFVLIVQVLVNLLDNALKYSPPGTPIAVQAQIADDALEMSVADRGYGVPRKTWSTSSTSSTACAAPKASGAPAWGWRSAKGSSRRIAAASGRRIGPTAGWLSRWPCLAKCLARPKREDTHERIRSPRPGGG